MKKFIDIHSHILPGVDDGSTDVLITKKMLEIAWRDGISTIIATPHFHVRHHTAENEKIEEAFLMTQNMAKKINPKFEIYLGRELFYSGTVEEQLSSHSMMTMNNSRYVLVEFMTEISYSELERTLDGLQGMGYLPILAHAERYECLVKHPERVEDLVDLGTYIQVNAGTVLGKNGLNLKKFVYLLLKYEKVHFIATDAHDIKHRKPEMQKCIRRIEQKYGKEYADRLAFENADKVVNNIEI